MRRISVLMLALFASLASSLTACGSAGSVIPSASTSVTDDGGRSTNGAKRRNAALVVQTKDIAYRAMKSAPATSCDQANPTLTFAWLYNGQDARSLALEMNETRELLQRPCFINLGRDVLQVIDENRNIADVSVNPLTGGFTVTPVSPGKTRIYVENVTTGVNTYIPVQVFPVM